MKILISIILVIVGFIIGSFYQNAPSEAEVNLSHAVFLAKSGLDNIAFHKSQNTEYLKLLGAREYEQLEAKISKVNVVLTSQEELLKGTCSNENCTKEQVDYLNSGGSNAP